MSTTGNIMQTDVKDDFKIGDVFTTSVSSVSGVIKTIIRKPYGVVLCLDVNGTTRWTTVKL